MARRYDRLIRFYSSWFADFFDEEKGFTSDELVLIFRVLWEAQMDANPDHIDTLPVSIKRGLSMATMREQIAKIIEKTETRRNISRGGGDAARAQGAAAPTARAADDAAQERRRAQLHAENAAKEAEMARSAQNNAFYHAAAKELGMELQQWFKYYKENPSYRLQLSLRDTMYKNLPFDEWEKARGFKK